jgi:hypothetical protein
VEWFWRNSFGSILRLIHSETSDERRETMNLWMGNVTACIALRVLLETQEYFIRGPSAWYKLRISLNNTFLIFNIQIGGICHALRCSCYTWKLQLLLLQVLLSGIWEQIWVFWGAICVPTLNRVWLVKWVQQSPGNLEFGKCWLKPHCHDCIRCSHFKVDDVSALEASSKPPVCILEDNVTASLH